MKIIDETGIVLTTEPDLEAGYLVEDVEVVHHDAVEGTAPQWHRETAKLPDGSPAIYYRDGKGWFPQPQCIHRQRRLA